MLRADVPRKFDSRVVNVRSSIAQSLHKFARIWPPAVLKEVEEPFESSQIGSSAMATNEIRCVEAFVRCTIIIAGAADTAMTAACSVLTNADDSATADCCFPKRFYIVRFDSFDRDERYRRTAGNENVIAKDIRRELRSDHRKYFDVAVKKWGPTGTARKNQQYSWKPQRVEATRGENNLLNDWQDPAFVCRKTNFPIFGAGAVHRPLANWSKNLSKPKCCPVSNKTKNCSGSGELKV
jgi:hypothetical protein